MKKAESSRKLADHIQAFKAKVGRIQKSIRKDALSLRGDAVRLGIANVVRHGGDPKHFASLCRELGESLSAANHFYDAVGGGTDLYLGRQQRFAGEITRVMRP